MKCLGTIFILFALLSNARLNFNVVSRLNILSNLNCACGVDIRRNLLICVNRFGMNIDLALLTRGNQNLTHEDNCLISTIKIR
jgi:hypothetical protein